jgi:hypothetical protein
MLFIRLRRSEINYNTTDKSTKKHTFFSNQLPKKILMSLFHNVHQWYVAQAVLKETHCQVNL